MESLLYVLGLFEQLVSIIYYLNTDQEKYLNLSEDEILALLTEQVLSEDEFSALKSKLICNSF